MHCHAPMVADKPFVTGPLRKALAAEKVYCYFESSHDYYWSLILYLAVPRPEKTIDDSPWLCDGHESVLECLQNIPRGANRADKDRCLAYLGKKNHISVKPTTMDHVGFGQFVVKRSLRTKTALMAFLGDNVEDEESRAAQACDFIQKLFFHQQRNVLKEGLNLARTSAPRV